MTTSLSKDEVALSTVREGHEKTFIVVFQFHKGSPDGRECPGEPDQIELFFAYDSESRKQVQMTHDEETRALKLAWEKVRGQ